MKTTKAAHTLSSHLAVIVAGYGVKHIAAAGWRSRWAMMGHLPDPAFVGELHLGADF